MIMLWLRRTKVLEALRALELGPLGRLVLDVPTLSALHAPLATASRRCPSLVASSAATFARSLVANLAASAVPSESSWRAE